jgi:hypothetical protein
MSRQATLVVADDASYTLTGKINLSGIYPTDINIPRNPTFAGQLVFMFVIETEPNDPYRQISLRVELPGGDSRQLELQVGTFKDGESDKIRWCLKFPLLFQNPVLRPGPIAASVIHDKGIILTVAPSLVLRPPATIVEKD